MEKTREVEYYRLWPGNPEDSRTWDTAYISIPFDTPTEKVEEAVREAARNADWCKGEAPVIVGLYCDTPEEDLACDGCVTHEGLRLNVSLGCYEPPEGFSVVERCDLCDKYPDDLHAARAVADRIQEVNCGSHHHIIARLYPSLVDAVNETDVFRGPVLWKERRGAAGGKEKET